MQALQLLPQETVHLQETQFSFSLEIIGEHLLFSGKDYQCQLYVTDKRVAASFYRSAQDQLKVQISYEDVLSYVLEQDSFKVFTQDQEDMEGETDNELEVAQQVKHYTDVSTNKPFVETLQLQGDFVIEIGGEAEMLSRVKEAFQACSDLNQSIQLSSQEEEEEEEEVPGVAKKIKK